MLAIERWVEARAWPKDRKYGVMMNQHLTDLTAGGIFCCMFGPSWHKMRIAIQRCNPYHTYSYRFGNYWHERYKEALKELTGFTSFIIYTSGSEAVEAFLRVAWVYTGKPNVWGGLIDPDEIGSDRPRCDQFHGWTLGSRILAGRTTWLEMGVYPEMGSGRFGQVPHTTACMAMEPYHAPSGQFHRNDDTTIGRIVNLRKEFPDILFLIDEIQGGFGRCGKLFAHEYYTDEAGNVRLKPDFVTIGKLAGAGFPLSVLCGPKEILESKEVIEHSYLHSTHSGNPITCSVGCLVIEEMLKQDMIGRSYRLGSRMHEWLAKLPVRVHGKGLMAGIEMADTEEADKVVARCLKRRVLVVQTGRKWVKIGPCLSIKEEDLEKGIKILGEVVLEVVSERPVDLEARRLISEKPESSGGDLETPRFQGGVERMSESNQDEGQEGSGDGASSG